MSFQSALDGLIKLFIAFYIGCAVVGRPDIPIKWLTQFRATTLSQVSQSWGCPSALNQSACSEYNPNKYR